MFVSEGAPERLSTERPETVLLRRIALRDRAAFAELFSLVAPKVKAYLIRLGTEAAGAEELTQDVLLTVWRKADQFDPAKPATGASMRCAASARRSPTASSRRNRRTRTRPRLKLS